MSTPVLYSPRIAFKSEENFKFLRCVYDKHERGIRIEASAERVVGSARTRFFVEKFDGDNRLVHVRCSYNNKYWAPQQVIDDGGRTHWVIGTAHEPNEDLSSMSCTLFLFDHPSTVMTKYFRCYHPGLKKYACVPDLTKPYLQLYDDGFIHLFNIIGLSDEKELPKNVVFKGTNGLYLHIKSYIYLLGGQLKQYEFEEKWKHDPEYAFLQFGEKEKGHPSVLHTTSTNDEGVVRIKSHENRMFWKYNKDFFFRAGSREDNFDDPYTLFKVVSAGDGFTALQNVGSKLYCKMLSGYGDGRVFFNYEKKNCLGAEVDWIGPAEKLTVEEPVRDRNIFDVNFHIDEARIHDMGDIAGIDQVHYNSGDSEVPFKFSFTRKRTEERKWETSITLKTFEEVRSSFGLDVPIPVLNDVSLSVHGESYRNKESTTVEDQGGFNSETGETKEEHTITVPPKTLARVKNITKHIHYDIPFSYKETARLLMNGEQLETVFHDDGHYTATERYNSFYVVNEPLE